MNIDKNKMEKIMKLVINEVKLALQDGNPPFAAFLLDMKGNIIYKSHNSSNSDIDPTAHAEINLIRNACKKLNTKDLSNYVLISNAWSCSMCMSASIKAKIVNYIFGTNSEPNMNPNVTIYDIEEKTKQSLNIITGIMAEECKKQIDEARKNKPVEEKNNTTNIN